MTALHTDDELAVEALRAWKGDTKRFAWDLFRFEPDAWQADVFDAFDDPSRQRIAMQACVGPGKTAVLAICCWKFLLCYSDGVNHPNGAAMSSDAVNLKSNLWKELNIWYGRSPVLQRAFEVTAETIRSREHPQTWFLSARSYPKTADSQEQGRTLSGLHARSILYLIDECGDTAPAVLNAAEQGLSNCEWGKILIAGNPTSLEGLLYHAAVNQARLWTVVRITGDPDDPKRSPRISLSWANEQIAEYGRENAWIKYSILGVFPPSSLNVLVGPDDMRAAMSRHLRIDQYDFAQKRLGIDVARFGDDSTVIFPRQGLAARNPVQMRGANSTAVASRVAMAKERWGSEMELIDDTGGWASGVIDQLALGGIPLVPVNFSSTKTDDSRYFNRRAEMNFRAARWIKELGGALPNVPQLVTEACAHKYWFEGSKFRILEKDQIKANLHGQSPDFWDAFCLTFAVVDMPGANSPLAVGAGAGHRGLDGGGTRGHAVSDWNPFE